MKPVRVLQSRRASSTSSRHNHGFTLLEVLMALAILAGAVAVLGELLRGGLRNAKAARDLTQAQMLAESKMSEVIVGLIALEAVAGGTFENDPDWSYDVELLENSGIELSGLTGVRVTVRRLLKPDANNTFALTRWVADPTVKMAAGAISGSTSSSTSGSTTSSSSSTPSGTSSGGTR